MIGHLHAFDILEKLLSGKQPFFACQVPYLQVAQAWVTDFALQGALRFLRNVKGKLEALPIQSLDLALHPQIEVSGRLLNKVITGLDGNFLSGQELLNLSGVGNLLLVVMPLAFSD